MNSGRVNLYSDDAGMSMVELIVAFVISGLFLGMLALMFVNGLLAQEAATARDQATGGANVAAQTLQSSVRSAAEFRVSASGARLDAVVAVPGADTGAGAWDWEWECRAWQVSGGALFYSAGSTARPADIVTAREPIVGGVAPSPAGGVPFAQGTGSLELQRQLTIALTVTTGDQTVTIRDAVTAQTTVQGGAPACW